MGCWNHTCCISNLHITAGQDVAVFLLVKNKTDSNSFCYGNAYYDVMPLPFYGKYDDYGGVEDCHGFGLPIILDHLKQRLYKFGQGPNQCHDCEVNAENFDITKLFEADHEGRLGIQHFYSFSSDEHDVDQLQKLRDEKGLTDSQQFELDRLMAKIKKVDGFRQVTHVVVHGQIFKDILEKWYIEEYVGEGKGNTGWGNNYIHVYYKDLIGSIPEYIQKKKDGKAEREKALKGAENEAEERLLMRLLNSSARDDWNSPNHAAKWLSYFSAGSSNVWALIDVPERIQDYIEGDKWEDLESFVKEVLTAAWINSFMSHTRKAWTKQVGQGSQNSEPLGYEVLANSVLEILKEEKREYESINDQELEEITPETDDPEFMLQL